jgi:radical SAM protein with 4Fe4S-binding SPASM domain
LIDEAVALGVRGLKLNYINEPMLRKDLEQCIAYAKSAGILNVYMVTNGTLLNAKRRTSMLDSGITKVFISVDAATSETYSRQRLSGKFDLVVKNILDFVEERDRRGLIYPLVRVSFLRNALNIHEEEAFREFWQGKVDMLAFQKMNDLPDLDSGLTLDDPVAESRGCTFPFKQLVVDYEGDILPCCKMGGKKLLLGNIDSMTLKEAWSSDKMKDLQLMHKDNRWHENPVCDRCISGSDAGA